MNFRMCPSLALLLLPLLSPSGCFLDGLGDSSSPPETLEIEVYDVVMGSSSARDGDRISVTDGDDFELHWKIRDGDGAGYSFPVSFSLSRDGEPEERDLQIYDTGCGSALAGTFETPCSASNVTKTPCWVEDDILSCDEGYQSASIRGLFDEYDDVAGTHEIFLHVEACTPGDDIEWECTTDALPITVVVSPGE